ncbi:MAG TPA: NAD(P)H-dependent glycerol-3-phosphate dehydrogenase [Pyrinomonadaceae bacterium]|nr:NAD(P)H-dependent glycerol-3-phosphate dehydrogenase [Pyrinomonadaceae bacterium]
MKTIAVIGAGSWGTALAIIAARAGHNVSLWSRNSAVVEAINRDHFNPLYLTGAAIPVTVHATGEIAEAKHAELIVLAVPSHAARTTLGELKDLINDGSIIVSATKGIEIETGKRISQIVDEVLPARAKSFVCFSGPSFAREVIENHPTAIVAASADADAARMAQSVLNFENLRIYTNDDLVGTELGGSVKNVMAIAAGMVSGLGFGSNSLAALITRGLAEMTRLALRQGAKLETMMGLSGLGDLVLTCTGQLSRNRSVGQQLAEGRSLETITATMTEVAEGVKTTMAVKRLADRLGIEMPITDQVYAVLYESKPVAEAARELMGRPLRMEFNRTDRV